MQLQSALSQSGRVNSSQPEPELALFVTIKQSLRNRLEESCPDVITLTFTSLNYGIYSCFKDVQQVIVLALHLLV